MVLGLIQNALFFTERLPHRRNLGCLTWSPVSEPISSRTHQNERAVIRATPQCMLARYSFEWLGDKKKIKAERPTHVGFSVRVWPCFAVAQSMYPPTYRISYVRHSFLACFGKSSNISHIQMTSQLLPPGNLPPKMIGRSFTVWSGVFCILVLTGGVHSEFCPFSPNLAPRGVLSNRGVFSP